MTPAEMNGERIEWREKSTPPKSFTVHKAGNGVWVAPYHGVYRDTEVLKSKLCEMVDGFGDELASVRLNLSNYQAGPSAEIVHSLR